MAKVTNAFTTYDAQADKEALSNSIFNIDPTATPFMSALGTKNVSNVVFLIYPDFFASFTFFSNLSLRDI